MRVNLVQTKSYSHHILYRKSAKPELADNARGSCGKRTKVRLSSNVGASCGCVCVCVIVYKLVRV